jgi:hypothetical protein
MEEDKGKVPEGGADFIKTKPPSSAGWDTLPDTKKAIDLKAAWLGLVFWQPAYSTPSLS